MREKLNLIPWGLAAAIAAGLILTAAGAAAETTAPDPSETPETQPAFEAGRVVFVDPATGRKELPSQAQRAAERARLGSFFNRSSAGLIETASPRSGVMVNLLGRFRHGTVLTVGDTGEVASQCTAVAPTQSTVATGEEVDSD